MRDLTALLWRHELRRRTGGYLAIVVVVALSGAVAMTALAGARRTASAFERHLDASDVSDLSINIARYDEANQAALEALPGVEQVRTYAAVLAGPFDPESGELFLDHESRGRGQRGRAVLRPGPTQMGAAAYPTRPGPTRSSSTRRSPTSPTSRSASGWRSGSWTPPPSSWCARPRPPSPAWADRDRGRGGRRDDLQRIVFTPAFLGRPDAVPTVTATSPTSGRGFAWRRARCGRGRTGVGGVGAGPVPGPEPLPIPPHPHAPRQRAAGQPPQVVGLAGSA